MFELLKLGLKIHRDYEFIEVLRVLVVLELVYHGLGDVDYGRVEDSYDG